MSGFDDPVSMGIVPEGEGVVLGQRFKLLRFLGSGSVGAVYEAYDANRSERVAIKVFFPGLTEDFSLRQRLIDSARRSANLIHPGVTRVFEMHEGDGLVWMCMELETGGSLRSWLEAEDAGAKGPPSDLASSWIHSVILVLESVSEKTIHLSLKPENIFPQAEGGVRLGDFGFQHCLDRRRANLSSLVTSSACYQAPETLHGEQHPDARADQFSVAAIYYQLLSGTPPVGIVEPLGLEGKKIPKKLEKTLRRALSPNPDDRFPSLVEFKQALQPEPRLFVWLRRVAAVAALVALTLALWAGAAFLLPDLTVGRGFQSAFLGELQRQRMSEAQQLWNNTALLLLRCDEIRSELDQILNEDTPVLLSMDNRSNLETSDLSLVALSEWADKDWDSLRGDVREALNRGQRGLDRRRWNRAIQLLTPWQDSVARQHVEMLARFRYLGKYFGVGKIVAGFTALNGANGYEEVWGSLFSPEDDAVSLTSRELDLDAFARSLTSRADAILGDTEEKTLQARQAFIARVGELAVAPLHLGDPSALLAEAQSLRGPESWARVQELYRQAQSFWSTWALEYDRLPVPTVPFTENSLGMRFVEIRSGLRMSVFETRLIDYESFVQHAGYDADRHWRWLHDEFVQTSPFEPVVNLLRDNCDAFCEWLTRFERSRGLIGADELYRMPTGEEWSWAAGPSANWDQTGGVPEEAVRRRNNLYLDDDGYEFTAPVGRFPPNALGLYDVEGNVAEWCQDRLGGETRFYHGFVRGATWRRDGIREIGGYEFPSTRHLYRDLGFRVVLVKTKL